VQCCAQQALPATTAMRHVCNYTHVHAAASENVASSHIKIVLQIAVYGVDTRTHQPLRVCPMSQQWCGSQKSIKVSLNISICIKM
jgi:hypothetical protein